MNNEIRNEITELLKKLKPFDLAAALDGARFVHVFDLPDDRPCRRIHKVDDPDHPFYALWAGEWLTYDQTEAGEAEMREHLRMYDARAWR